MEMLLGGGMDPDDVAEQVYQHCGAALLHPAAPSLMTWSEADIEHILARSEPLSVDMEELLQRPRLSRSSVTPTLRLPTVTA